MGLQSHASGTDVTWNLRPPRGGLIIQCERYMNLLVFVNSSIFAEIWSL